MKIMIKTERGRIHRVELIRVGCDGLEIGFGGGGDWWAGSMPPGPWVLAARDEKGNLPDGPCRRKEKDLAQGHFQG
jgi:hypothetical protein